MSEEVKDTSPNATGANPDGAPAAQSATAAQPAPDRPAEPALAEQLAAAKKEAADNYDRYVRSVADLENFRRRTLREKDDLRQYAAGRVLEDMFPIIEAISLGIDAAKKPGADAAGIVEGMGMVLTQIKNALASHGLKEINPAVSEKFDPHQHEAIAAQPSAEIAEGDVMQVFRVGYALNGRVLRPASVVVSSGAGNNRADNEK